MKKMYSYLFAALLLITHSAYSDYSAYKSKDPSGTKLIIVAACSVLAGALGAWKLASYYWSQQIKTLVAIEVEKATKEAEIAHSKNTEIKRLADNQEIIIGRLDHLEDTIREQGTTLSQYGNNLDALTHFPEIDPVRAAYVVWPSPRQRSSSMPPRTPRPTQINEDLDGELDYLIAYRQAVSESSTPTSFSPR